MAGAHHEFAFDRGSVNYRRRLVYPSPPKHNPRHPTLRTDRRRAPVVRSPLQHLVTLATPHTRRPEIELHSDRTYKRSNVFTINLLGTTPVAAAGVGATNTRTPPTAPRRAPASPASPPRHSPSPAPNPSRPVLLSTAASSARPPSTHAPHRCTRTRDRGPARRRR